MATDESIVEFKHKHADKPHAVTDWAAKNENIHRFEQIIHISFFDLEYGMHDKHMSKINSYNSNTLHNIC